MLVYKNKKTGDLYELCPEVELINTTNAQDGQKMLMYASLDGEKIFVREKEEFFSKFIKEESHITYEGKENAKI